MRKVLPYAVVLATLLAVACTDRVPTANPELTRAATKMGKSRNGAVDQMIVAFFPTGLETITGQRWDRIDAQLGTWNVTTKSWSGDVAGANTHTSDLVKLIQLKTYAIDQGAIGNETKEHAASRLIAAMLAYVNGGPGISPPSPNSDVVVVIVPPGQPTTIVTPNETAGLDLPAGSTSEERIIVIAEDTDAEAQFTARCSGPLTTTHCQFPKFYRYESLPHLRLNTPAHFAVCLQFTGSQAPGIAQHERARLAHDLPSDPADYTPGAVQTEGIEILPLVPSDQQGSLAESLNCEHPNVIGMSPMKRALYRLAELGAKILGPKKAYAYDQGPEHFGLDFSNFTGVDPWPKGAGTSNPDGVMATGEWDNAITYPITANVTETSTAPATLYVMNDDRNVYFAVRVPRSSANHLATNGVTFEFDGNNDGSGPANHDDVLGFFYSQAASTATQVFTDQYRNTCNGIPAACVIVDRADGSGAFQNDGTYSVFEISHPLNSGETERDFARAQGDKLGIFLQLTVDGVSTSWPGSTPTLSYFAHTLAVIPPIP